MNISREHNPGPVQADERVSPTTLWILLSMRVMWWTGPFTVIVLGLWHLNLGEIGLLKNIMNCMNPILKFISIVMEEI